MFKDPTSLAYHRAVVVDLMGANVKLALMDTGESRYADKRDLRCMPVEMRLEPARAQACGFKCVFLGYCSFSWPAY